MMIQVQGSSSSIMIWHPSHNVEESDSEQLKYMWIHYPIRLGGHLESYRLERADSDGFGVKYIGHEQLQTFVAIEIWDTPSFLAVGLTPHCELKMMHCTTTNPSRNHSQWQTRRSQPQQDIRLQLSRVPPQHAGQPPEGRRFHSSTLPAPSAAPNRAEPRPPEEVRKETGRERGRHAAHPLTTASAPCARVGVP